VSALLAVDGGQTGLRLALVGEDGAPDRVAVVDGFSHGASDPDGATVAAVLQARDALGVDAAVRRIALGLTGAPPTRSGRVALGAALSERLGGAEVVLGPDMVTAHAGALDGAPGVVIAAGTGAVALAVAADGTAARADGLGHVLGDDGSGFAIGRAGVRAALRAKEERGPATELLTAATAFFGGLDDLPHRLARSATPVADLAAFTPDVAAVARAGDAVAAGIWADAAAGLVATTVSALGRVFGAGSPAGSVPVAHTGRLFAERELLLAPFVAGLAERCPAAAHREPDRDPLLGAARLAARGAGPYADLMHTTEGRPA
jgi:glucosamine kinase